MKLVQSRLLVIAQIVCIVLMGRHWNRVEYTPFIIALLTLSAAPGAWALATLNRHMSIFPEPKAGAVLVTTGPFKFVRHPMYTTLIFGGSIFVAYGDLVTLASWLILIGVLIAKVSFEEKLLTQTFENYADYQKHTKKFIPFLF